MTRRWGYLSSAHYLKRSERDTRINLNVRQEWPRIEKLHGNRTQVGDVTRRYGTQSVMKVGLNQPNEKQMTSVKSDVLTESVTEDSANDQQISRKLPVRRAKKVLKRLRLKTGTKTVNQKVVKSKASAVVASLASAARPGESGQGNGATMAGGERENLRSLMLLAGLTATATRLKKNARILADTKLEM